MYNEYGHSFVGTTGPYQTLSHQSPKNRKEPAKTARREMGSGGGVVV